MAAVYDIVSMDNGMVLSCAKYQTERLGGIGGTGIGDNEGAKGGRKVLIFRIWQWVNV